MSNQKITHLKVLQSIITTQCTYLVLATTCDYVSRNDSSSRLRNLSACLYIGVALGFIAELATLIIIGISSKETDEPIGKKVTSLTLSLIGLLVLTFIAHNFMEKWIATQSVFVGG